MRKITAIVLMVLLTIGFAGCNNDPNYILTTYTRDPNAEKPGCDGERRLTHFFTLDEIEEFTKTGKTPVDFVMFDAISILGQFDGYLVFIYDYYYYSYSAIDEKGFDFSVEVNHELFYEPEKLLEKTEGMSDMKTTGTDEKGAIILGPLMYHYVKGSLRLILINVDGVQVAINLQNHIKEYPVDENGNYTTIIERMVFGDEEEALEAADEFITFFRENR